MGKTSATNPGSGNASPPTGGGYEVKASTLRAYMAQIAKLGVLSDVMAKVHPDTRRAMEAPPLPSVWIDGMVIEDMISALESLRGMDAVRTVTREGHGAVGLPILKPIVSGLLRVFGGSPNTLFSRWPEITKTALRGVTFQWVLDTDTSGRLTVIFPRKNVPRSAYVGMESGCWLVLDLCGAKGVVAATEITNEGSTGTIRVHW
jgi:hypothetical protein